MDATEVSFFIYGWSCIKKNQSRAIQIILALSHLSPNVLGDYCTAWSYTFTVSDASYIYCCCLLYAVWCNATYFTLTFIAGGLISSGNTIGVHVVTPFKLSGRQEEVLVSRGWVSRKQHREGDIHRPNGKLCHYLYGFGCRLWSVYFLKFQVNLFFPSRLIWCVFTHHRLSGIQWENYWKNDGHLSS